MVARNLISREDYEPEPAPPGVHPWVERELKRLAETLKQPAAWAAMANEAVIPDDTAGPIVLKDPEAIQNANALDASGVYHVQSGGLYQIIGIVPYQDQAVTATIIVSSSTAAPNPPTFTGGPLGGADYGHMTFFWLLMLSPGDTFYVTASVPSPTQGAYNFSFRMNIAQVAKQTGRWKLPVKPAGWSP